MHKNARKFDGKLRAKLPATTGTGGYSMVKFARLDDAFSEFFELEVCPVVQQNQCSQKIRKGENGKVQKR